MSYLFPLPELTTRLICVVLDKVGHFQGTLLFGQAHLSLSVRWNQMGEGYKKEDVVSVLISEDGV